MACSWRIRHKLILGMSLVAAVMALLLGGTLYGLASYRAAMSTCVRKIDEIDLAVQNLKGEISKLRDQAPEATLQAGHIQKQIPEVEKALDKYAAQAPGNRGQRPRSQFRKSGANAGRTPQG